MNIAALAKLAGRNATRKPLRTALTAGMVVVGTGLLVVSLSWLNGIFGGMIDQAIGASGHVRIVKQEFLDREKLMPLYENIPEVQPILDAVTAHPDIVAAYPRIMGGATVTVGEEIGEVFGLVQGAPAEYFTKWVQLDAALTEGRFFEAGTEEVVLGHEVAKRAGAKLGDEVVLLGMTQDGSISPIKGELVGIVRQGNGLVDRGIFVPFARMQWMTDIPDGAIEVVAYGREKGGAIPLAAAMRDLPEVEGLSVQAWSESEMWANMLKMVDAIRGMLVFVLVFLAALGVWNTMMMSVLERTDEIGVMRAMGMGRLGAVLLFVGEASAIAILGGVVGVGLGAIPAWYLTKNGIEIGEQVTQNIEIPFSTTMYAELSPDVMVQAFAMGLVMAVIGSALPALRAALIQPVVAMRSGR